MRLIVFLTATGGDGYLTPSKISARMSDEPLISEVCYLMQRFGASLAPNEPSPRSLSSLRDLIKEPEQRPQSALRRLLGAIPEQSEPEHHGLLWQAFWPVITKLSRHQKLMPPVVILPLRAFVSVTS